MLVGSASGVSYFPFLQFSYASSSSTLNNRGKFPDLWRIISSESSLAPSLISVLEQYGWKTLRIITQEEPIFIEVSSIYTVVVHISVVHK